MQRAHHRDMRDHRVAAALGDQHQHFGSRLPFWLMPFGFREFDDVLRGVAQSDERLSPSPAIRLDRKIVDPILWRPSWLPSSKQLRAHRREFHIGAGPIQRQPAAIDRQIKVGLVLGRAGLVLIQKRRVDQLDVDTAVLNGLDRIGDLDQLAGGLLRIGVGAIRGEFHGHAGIEARDA